MRITVVIATLLLAAPSLAHIEMDFPTPKFNDGANKWCPCGPDVNTGTSRSNAACALETSDNDRGSTSNSFQAGQQITVRWRETIGHSGRFRVAFDPSGADLADFNANILGDIADNASNNAGGNNWEMTVTLPSTPCTNCTLQLIQVMGVSTATAIASPAGSQTYFQCANLVLTAPGGGEGEGEGDPPGGEGEGEPPGGEGEGDPPGGEGEGDPPGGEGEGEEGEGEEGEGEGEPPACPGCTAAGTAPFALGLALLALRGRARRRR